MIGFRRVAKSCLAVAAFAAALMPHMATAQRERIRISEDWRFIKGDPTGLTADLRYDVRPSVEKSADGRVADAPPEAAAEIAAADAQVLKPWILPTGNGFIADPARRHIRPAGDPGSEVSFVQQGFDDSKWQRVTLPHDWAIAGPFLETGPYGGMGRLPSWGIGWYRKQLAIPASDRGRSIFLDVDGAMAYATVWLNGRLVGGWPYGYNGWRLDLTPYVSFGGPNQLAIRLDNPPESSRWYPGGGLYRDVWLVKTNRVHVAHWGSTVTTPLVSKHSATIAHRLILANDGAVALPVSATTEIYVAGPDGRRTGSPVARFALGTATIAAGGTAVLTGNGDLSNPRLWGPPPAQQPNLYVAVATVRAAGRVIDAYETPFGIRTVAMNGRDGLVVNGEKVKLQGVNNHHDLGALGAAFNIRAAERQLEILREMGVNALRMSHNPPASELLDLADRMGFVVIDEVFDAWERKKTPLDFHLIFKDWGEQDLRAMLRRDRNHPSVIMWSIGNEVGEQYTGEEGAKVARRLVAIVREEDPTRQTTTSMNYARPEMPLPTTIDAIGINYQGAGVRSLPPQYRPFAEKFPGKILFESESASTLSSRGEYLFPVSGSISGPVRPGSGGDPARQQVSAYEIHAADFGSSPDREFAAMDQNPTVAGEFVWTGFDYLGEPTPYYGARSSYSGIVDLAGFPKDRFWLYQSRWRPDLKFAHILPHWTWPGREGQVTPVHVFTSADEAELFVNGKSQGKQKRAPFAYRFRWDYVTYEPGEVKVVTWKEGKPWATQTVTTTGSPAILSIEADRSRIKGDGRDLAFVTVRVQDADGRTAPTASNTIRFTVSGPGELVATDNGDPTSFIPFPSATRPAFNGLALAIVRARPGAKGAITVRAQSDGLAAGVITLTAR